MIKKPLYMTNIFNCCCIYLHEEYFKVPMYVIYLSFLRDGEKNYILYL